MKVYEMKKIVTIIFVLALLLGEQMPVKANTNTTVSGGAVSDIPTATPAATPTGEPIVAPTFSPTPTIVPTATPAPVVDFKLTNKGAKYYKGGQTGIKYNRVKGKKIYHIVSYVTDTVKLNMTHASTFSVYGGGSKKEVKKKYATVSAKGEVRSNRKGKGENLYTIIEAKSKLTGEVQYIHIYFKRKLYRKTKKTITLYEREKTYLSFDYGKKNLSFSVANKKTAVVNKDGRVKAVKKGKTTVTAKVKGSVSNQVEINIIVKEVPWIVSKKDKVYDYEDMEKDLQELSEKYAGRSELTKIGKSYDKRKIYCLRIGKENAKRKLVIDAAIHGREWKNTQILMRQTEEMLRDYPDYKKRFESTCIYILPMTNPDGVTISQYGFKAIKNKKLQKLCKKIGKRKIWKANARGVDLNNNFPAGFKKNKYHKKPDYMGYSGKKAGSEKESKALMKFINKVKPDSVLNLHSTGSIIYWDFNVGKPLHDKLQELAEKVSSFNEYRLMPKTVSTNACGGFADWLVYKKDIASITLETGTVVCPLPHSQFKKIYKKNNKMFRWYMTKYK